MLFFSSPTLILVKPFEGSTNTIVKSKGGKKNKKGGYDVGKVHWFIYYL